MRKEGKGVQIPVPVDSPTAMGPEETLRAALAEETESDPWEKEDPWNDARSREKEPASDPVSYGPGAFSYEQGGAPGLSPPRQQQVFSSQSPPTWTGQQPGVWQGYPSPLPGGDWVLPGYPPGGFGVQDMVWWLQFLNYMKGTGKGYPEPWMTDSRVQGKKKEEREGREGSKKRGDPKEEEKRPWKKEEGHQDDGDKGRGGDQRVPPWGGGDPPGGNEAPSGGGSGGGSTGHHSDVSSSVDTSELRSMVRGKARAFSDRPKASLGSVKIEEFYGDRTKYLKWKKAVQAQEVLYRLEEAELSMLVYLSTKKDARDVLDQQPISEYTRAGGIQVLWRLLDEAFGETEDEWFERAETEFTSYRRLPAQSIATYLGQLKRLKAQYMRADPGTTISDRAWSQRMLNRASLSRRERLDVFFSANGRYEPVPIEAALRHRCARIHEEERKIPTSTFGAQKRPRRSFGRKGDGKRRGNEFRKTYYVDEDDEEQEDIDGEDLEQDESAYKAYVMNLEEDGPGDDEEQAEEEDEDWDGESAEEELKEAWAAGWKAKSQQNEKKKFRGWKSSGKGSGGDHKDKRKVNSTCASCGEVGHWRGDPQCRNVKSGKDAPHKKKEASSSLVADQGAHVTHYTYVVSTEQMRQKLKKARGEGFEDPPHPKCLNPSCGFPVSMSDRFCSRCGTRVPGDDRMNKDKRGWQVVNSDDDDEPTIISSSSASTEKDKAKEKKYQVSRGALREATGKTVRPEDDDVMVRVTAQEVLIAMPFMSKKEKKEIKIQIKAEEDAEAGRTYATFRGELGLDESGRPSGARGCDERGYPSNRDQMPIPPSKEVSARMPKAWKTQKLDEFRRKLHDDQWKNGRLVPSSCAPTPNATQAKCTHPFECIRWSANGEGHYGKCRKCDLQHVIYYQERHGALVACHDSHEKKEVFNSQGRPGPRKTQNELNYKRKKPDPQQQPGYVTSRPGEAVADSGCRCAVAGKAWHEKMKEELSKKGMSWLEVGECESFRFGSGEPEISERAYIYPVGIYGKNDLVRISCVGGGATFCPGLIGPSELSRWGAVASFGDRSLELKGVKKRMKLTATRHPAIDLLEFQEGTQGPQFWKAKEIQETLKILQEFPQTWAFVTESKGEADDTTDEEVSTEEETGSEGEEEEKGKLLRSWMDRLDEHLHHMPVETLELEEDDEELIPDYSSEGTITSHEFGVELEESEVESEESELESYVAEEDTWPVKILSKHEKRKIGHHLSELMDCYESEAVNKKPARTTREEEEEVLHVHRGVRSGPKGWKVLEVFTWTCMVSLVAAARGWTMMEPVSLPGWNLLDPQTRQDAHKYIDEVKPDLIVLAWPCRLWSPLQALNYRTTQEKAKLGELRQMERPLLNFVEEVAAKQRRRGGAILGENPLRSRAWEEPAIIAAFQGMDQGQVDMCTHGLRRPDDGKPLKKPTRLVGTTEILEECCKKCPGGHQHAPVMGAMKVNGKWKSVSEFAGGYTRRFAEAVVRGAEKFLKKRRGGPVEELWCYQNVAEENFIGVEEAEEEDV